MHYKTKKQETKYEGRKPGIFRRAALSAGLATMLACSGCVTGIIERPDFSQVKYGKNGKPTYNGREVELRYVLPWYQDMWPDSPAEWIIPSITGIGGFFAGGGLDSGGSSERSSETKPSNTVTPSSSSGGDSRGSTPTGGTTPPPSNPPADDGDDNFEEIPDN